MSIVHEDHPWHVRKTTKGFEVYEHGITAAKRCAIIGWTGERGFQKALEEIERRKAEAEPRPMGVRS